MPEMIVPRVAILAGFGGFNVGDEAIFSCMVRGIRSRLPRVEICVMIDAANADEQTLKAYRDLSVEVRDKKSARDILYACARTHVIFGGGQVIASQPAKLQIYQALFILLNRAFLKRPLMVGGGVEEITNLRTRLFLRWVFSRLHLIACRDALSRDLLIGAGVPKRKLVLTADFVFLDNLDMPQYKTDTRKDSVLVALEHSSGYCSRSADQWREVIEKVSAQYPNSPVHVIAHDRRADYDAGLLRTIETQHPSAQVQFSVLDTVDNALALYGNAALVISSRMHPIILGALSGAALQPLEGRRKLRAVMERLGVAPATYDAMTREKNVRPVVPSRKQLDALKSAAELNLDLIENTVTHRGSRRERKARPRRG